MTDEISIMAKRLDICRFIRRDADEELVKAVWQLIEDRKTDLEYLKREE